MKNELKQLLHNSIMESLLYLSDRRTKKYPDTLGYFHRLARETELRCGADSVKEMNKSMQKNESEMIKVKEYMLSLSYFLYQERVK